jgi:hypothetical protein
MSASATLVGERAQQRVLLTLARLHAKRYLRHPLYLLGVVLLVGGVLNAWRDPDGAGNAWDDGLLYYPVYLGILGLVVAYRLTVTEDRALALLPSAPTDQRVRTLALCLACLVPVVTCLLFMTAIATVNQLVPAGPDAPFVLRPDTGEIGWVGYVSTQLEIVVACYGGPVLGIAVARWWRFPGAGVLAAVLLFLVEILALGLGEGGAYWLTWWTRAVDALVPYVYWKAAPGVTGYTTMRPGSPTGHVLYALALCGLAITAAVLRDASPAVRATWRRVGGVLLTVAAVGYAWALLG